MNKIAILSTGPESLTGAGIIHFQTLEKFRSELNCLVEFVSFGLSDYFENLYTEIKFHKPYSVAENSRITHQVLPLIALQEAIVARAVLLSHEGYKVILYSTYLYPYSLAMLYAKSTLSNIGIQTRFIVQPAGSDIWKFGSDFLFTTQNILMQADTVAVYSNQFGIEVKACSLSDLDYYILPPIVDTNKFKPVQGREKSRLRNELQISDEAKVLISVSNNRYIKAIANSIEIAYSVSIKLLNSEVILLIIGPFTEDLLNALSSLICEKQESNTYEKYTRGNLVVRCYREQFSVEYYLQAADLFLNTSYHDSFNLSICESLSCGIPFVSSSVVGMKELENSGEGGYFFQYPRISYDDLKFKKYFKIPSSEMFSLIGFINCYFHDDKIQNSMSLSAKRCIVDSLTWEKQKDRYEKILSI